MRAETALWGTLLVVLGATISVAAVGAAGGVGASATADDRGAGQPTASPTPTDERTVHLDIQLLASGDANWTVRTYVPLDGPTERESFRELGRRFENGTADVDFDVGLFRRYVAIARSASGRDMGIAEASVDRSWTTENGTGVLTLEFTWTNFAREEGDRYVVDDAFRTRDGTWLPRLEAGQVLVIRPPEGVGFREAPIGVSNATLRWEGPQQFGPNYFVIEYRPNGRQTPDTATSTSPDSSPPSETTPDAVPGMGPVLVGLLAVGTVLGFLVLQRRRGSGDGPWRAGDDDDGTPSTGVAAGGAADTTSEAPKPDTSASTDGDPEPTPEDPFAGVDVGMLSDEERVIRLLQANGGRMKQARIVKETDWSNAKVSQLLSSMEESGEIDKLRIGRENLISLPDVEVDRFQT